jgi:hypothetical protein
MKPVPREVYAAAVRVYVGSTTDPVADYARVQPWAEARWGHRTPVRPEVLAFWITSIAAQIGYQRE